MLLDGTENGGTQQAGLGVEGVKVAEEIERGEGMPFRRRVRKELAESALFPPGHLSLIVGHPGTGKSLLGLHLAARMSVHLPLPPEMGTADPIPEDMDVQTYCDGQTPGASLIFSREDDAFTIKSRLAVAFGGNNARPGADMRFIELGKGSLVLPPRPGRGDRTEGRALRRSSLDDAIRGSPFSYARLRLVVIDPLPAFLGHVDGTNNAALIREALEPVLAYAAQYRFAVVGISHVNKQLNGPLVARAARSFAYTALARSVVMVVDDPLERGRKLVVPIKNNLADVPGGYAFRIKQAVARVEREDDPFGRGGGVFERAMPYVEWETGLAAGVSGVAMTVSQAMVRLKIDDAKDFLRQVLAEGEMWSGAVQKEARTVGISMGTLWRAAEDLGVQKRREGGRWWMRMA